jgi:S-adenosylmethionine/arginine decarboxylase-like enzyme
MEKILIQNLFVSVLVEGKKYASNEEALRELVDKIIVGLDMTVIIPTASARLAVLGEFAGDRKDSRPGESYGLTSLTGIAESHIAIHTWPEHNLIYMEISSCKEFDERVVKEIIDSYFPDNFGIEIWNNKRHVPGGNSHNFRSRTN